MKNESPDEVEYGRDKVQRPSVPSTSKVPEQRLTTDGAKVTHTSSKRAKKTVRTGDGLEDESVTNDKPGDTGSAADTDRGGAAPSAEATVKATWIASGVATGWDGAKAKPPASEPRTKPTTKSLFARDDEAQRQRPPAEQTHRSPGADDDVSDPRAASSSGSAGESSGRRTDRADARSEVAEDGDDSVTPLRSALEWIVAIGLAVLAALFIKTFLLQAFVIPSGSMLPALQDRDRVLVSKQTYRFVDIQQGDVVVFDNPDWQPNEPEQLIKRVIGLPGDSVEVREGQVIVNGKIIVEDAYLAEGTITDDEPRTVVPDDAVFVMGDNRRNSKDSRVVGPIKLDSFTGHAFVRIWPPSRIGGL